MIMDTDIECSKKGINIKMHDGISRYEDAANTLNR